MPSHASSSCISYLQEQIVALTPGHAFAMLFTAAHLITFRRFSWRSDYFAFSRALVFYPNSKKKSSWTWQLLMDCECNGREYQLCEELRLRITCIRSFRPSLVQLSKEAFGFVAYEHLSMETLRSPTINCTISYSISIELLLYIIETPNFMQNLYYFRNLLFFLIWKYAAQTLNSMWDFYAIMCFFCFHY